MKKGLISRAGCLPYNPKLNDRARELRRNMTEAEKKLWYEYLRQHRLTFHRQKPIDQFIVDFYCSSEQLVIEIDGGQHYTPDEKIYDQKRTAVLEGYGLSVLRFTNDDVMKNFEGVCQMIEQRISGSKPPTPL